MFRPSQQIGSYFLVRRIGRGGFGEVWLAERRTALLTTRVAVKLPLDSQIDLETVRQEAVLWEKASGHPNVLPIIEADIYDEQVVIVSEYAPDGSLADLLKREVQLPAAKAVELICGITAGLEFLHSRRIIHRDLKPANILLQGETPRLADFGISHALQTSIASRSMTVKGTFSYMSPEAFDGKRNEQTDIWSVGIILYQLLRGGLPFPQEDSTALFGAIMMREPEPLPDSVPPKLKQVVAGALAKLPENRYQTAREMREDLQKILIAVNYPAAAPTEILRHPPLLLPPVPVIQPPISRPPTTQDNAPPGETNYQSIRFQVQSPPAEKKNEPDGHPAIETNQPFLARSIVTQIKPLQTQGATKPQLPIVAEALAGKTRNPGSSYKILAFAGGAGVLGLLLILGAVAVYNLNRFKQTSNSNAATANAPGNVKTQTNLQSNASTNSLSNRATVSIPADGRLIPYLKGDKWGFVDGNKKFIIEPKYEGAEQFYEELANVKLNGKWGFIDKTGNEVIPFKYDSAEPFSTGVALVFMAKGNQNITSCCYGIIDKTGREIAPPRFREARNFSDGLSMIGSPSVLWRHSYVDQTGKVLFPYNFHEACDFSEGLACVSLAKETLEDDIKNGNKRWGSSTLEGYIDKTGKTVIPLRYDNTNNFSDGLASVSLNDKWGFIDKTGKTVIEMKYDRAGNFVDGIAPVKLNDKWGFIDKTGTQLLPFKYDDASSFFGNLAAVELNGKWGFIDKSGTEIIPFKYGLNKYYLGADFAKPTGLAYVSLNDKKFYIDRNGTEYYEP